MILNIEHSSFLPVLAAVLGLDVPTMQMKVLLTSPVDLPVWST